MGTKRDETITPRPDLTEDEEYLKRIRHQQQGGGNHDLPEDRQGGPDRFGGTRKGAENVEPDEKTR